MKTTASSARSRSASSNTITGFLPPSSKCTRFSVAAPCRMIWLPVRVSPTNATALIAGCSVSALPASSPNPCTQLRTPSGKPASCAISDNIMAVYGDHSAGLCTTVHPAASAGAIFQVDSMKGVFHGVMTPTGPIGWRIEKFRCSSAGSACPSLAPGAMSPKKRKFAAPRIAALLMNRNAWPESTLSTRAMSRACASIASATLCIIFLRSLPDRSRQFPKAASAALQAASMSSAFPAAIFPMTLLSTGVRFSNVFPERPPSCLPLIKCGKVFLRNRASSFSVSRWFVSKSLDIYFSFSRAAR